MTDLVVRMENRALIFGVDEGLSEIRYFGAGSAARDKALGYIRFKELEKQLNKFFEDNEADLKNFMLKRFLRIVAESNDLYELQVRDNANVVLMREKNLNRFLSSLKKILPGNSGFVDSTPLPPSLDRRKP